MENKPYPNTNTAAKARWTDTKDVAKHACSTRSSSLNKPHTVACSFTYLRGGCHPLALKSGSPPRSFPRAVRGPISHSCDHAVESLPLQTKERQHRNDLQRCIFPLSVRHLCEALWRCAPDQQRHRMLLRRPISRRSPSRAPQSQTPALSPDLRGLAAQRA